MEIACEETVHVVGAELELQQDGDISTQRTQSLGSWIIPKHYNLQEDSSEEEEEEEDWVGSQALLRGFGDCVCCVCGERFAFLARLIEHFGVHGPDVRCHLCQVTFPRVISLALHLENSHPGYRLFCDSCGLSFRTAWHMNEHMEKHSRRKEMQGARTLLPSTARLKPHKEEVVEEAAVVENEEMDVRYLEEGQDVAVTELEGAREMRTSDVPEEEWLAARACKLDHNYFCTRSFSELPTITPTLLSEHVRNMHSSARETTDNVNPTSGEMFYADDSKMDNRACSRVSEPERGQHEELEVVVLRNLPQREGWTSASILEAAYEKVMKSQSEGYEGAEVEGNRVGSFSLAVQETVPLELNIKVEDNHEDCGWDRGPIQEEVVKSDEDSVQSSDQDDGDSLPPGDSMYTPEEDLDSDTDSVASASSDDSAGGLQRSHSKGRNLRSKSGKRRRACVDVGRKALAAIPKPGSARDGVLCASCGLRRGTPLGGAAGPCRCPPPPHTCCLCGLVQASEEQLLKHQAEKHPSTKYVCASCLHIFPDQNIFTRHACCSKPKASAGPPPAPAKNAGGGKNLPLMIVNFVPSPSAGGPAKPPPCTDSGQCRAMPTILLTNNVINVVNPVQKLSTVANSTLPILPNKPASPTNQPVPVQVLATMSLNSEQKVTGLVLKGAPGSGVPLSTVTQAETGQLNVVTQSQARTLPPAPCPADVRPAKAMLLQGVVMSQRPSAPTSQAIRVPLRMPPLMASLLGPSAASESPQPLQSRVALRIPTYPCASNKVSVSFSPTPVQFPAPVLVSANGPKALPPRSQLLAGNVRPVAFHLPPPGTRIPTPVSTPIPAPIPGPVPTLGPAPRPVPIHAPCPSPIPISIHAPRPGPIPISIHAPRPTPISAPGPARALGPTSALAPLSNMASTPAQFAVHLPAPPSASPSTPAPSQSQGPLKIVAMFVNQSQELALQKRLHQSWRSKAIFPCRQCGAVSRQPSLGVRHRYQHRGPRRHRCQCGRAFQQRLHLLRHQVQHAEAVRYVCAACGRTFQGMHHLSRHRPDVLRTSEKECRNVFHCDCGQVFARPAALLWHMLNNSTSRKKRLKKLLL